MSPSERTREWLAQVPDEHPMKTAPSEPILDDRDLGDAWLGDIGPIYFDRDGEPLSLREWSLLKGMRDYNIIRQEYVGPYWVSTVWVGMDMGIGLRSGCRPIIFETMVFSGDERDRRDFDQRRYSTEAQALAGHQEVVNEVRLIVAATEDIDPRDLPKEDE